ncbi:hypothetical protein JCM5296_005683 [Sporobolomyces johnsonii]
MPALMLASPRRLPAILAVAALLVAVASARPGRFPCGTVEPNQRVCDLLSHPTARRSIGVPVDSECVEADGAGFFCGWAGASCSSDSQCDFGHCSGDSKSAGVCMGRLGDSCEGPEGIDDSLCAGNVGCQPPEEGIPGQAVCGGAGAVCSFEGIYQATSKPNHDACVSKQCDPSTLTCTAPPSPLLSRDAQKPLSRGGAPSAPPWSSWSESTKLAAQAAQAAPRTPPPSAQQERILSVPLQFTLPEGATCPTGFTVCPIPRSGGSYDFACYDTTTSATHCGGCPGIGAGFWPGTRSGSGAGATRRDEALANEGVDCMAIQGVASAACVDSKCRIFACSPNYVFDLGKGGCVPKRYW